MKKIDWILPDFKTELFELRRYISEIRNYKCKSFFTSESEAHDYFFKGQIVTVLNPCLAIENTDMNLVNYFNQGLLEYALLLKYYADKGKCCFSITDTYMKGGSMTSIILFNVRNKYYEMVSGNTRYIMSKIHKINANYFVITL